MTLTEMGTEVRWLEEFMSMSLKSFKYVFFIYLFFLLNFLILKI